MSSSSSNAEEQQIFAYLRDTNRPYNANDLFTNLHKQIGKSALQKCLDNLVQSGSIIEKVYGKQRVYVMKQEGLQVLDGAQLKQLDADISAAELSLKQQQAELRDLEQRLTVLNNTLTEQEISDKIAKLMPDLEAKERKVSEQAEGSARQVTPAQFKEARRLLVAMATEWRKRKRMCMDMAGCVLEGYPATKKAFFEEVGIETDEECNAKMPEL